MPDGSIHLTRLSSDPELYSATFETEEGPRAGQTARTFTRIGELDEFLQHAGIRGDRIQLALRDASESGTSSIPGVALGDRELEDLGLVKSSGTKQVK